MKGEHPIRMLCELLTVSHSGYYRWLQQRPSTRHSVTGRVKTSHGGPGQNQPP